MKRITKGMILFLTFAMLITSLSACKKTKEEGSTDTTGTQAVSETTGKKVPDPVTLNIYLFGEESKHYRNVDGVISEIENRVKDTLNTKLNITWTPPADYKQKLPMWIASGEDIDLMFDAPWMSLSKMASDGAYADLGKYFNNDQYPGLKKAFSADFINSNKVLGKAYAIPITNTFMDMEGIIYRKDLLEKYGMKPIASYDDLYDFLTKVQENEDSKKYVGYANYGDRGFFKEFWDRNDRELNGRVYNLMSINNMEYLQVAFSADGKSVSGIATLGDTDENYKGFDPKYGKQFVIDLYNTTKKYNKFLIKDVLVAGTTLPPFSGAQYTTLNSYQTELSKLKVKDPNAELAFWPLQKNCRELTPGGQSTDFKAWNFAAVPVASKKIDRTMAFLDWLYGSQENVDLLIHGIEGKDWTAIGDKQWKVPDGVDGNSTYMWPGYQLGWTPAYYRTVEVPEEMQKYFDYEFSQDTFKANLLAGFSFNTEPVKAEMAKCATINDKYIKPLLAGVFDDPEAELKKFSEELNASGVDKIKAEITKQLNEFLASK